MVLSWCHLLNRKALWSFLIYLNVLFDLLFFLQGRCRMTLETYSAFVFGTAFIGSLCHLCCGVHKRCIYFLADVVILAFKGSSSQSWVLTLKICHFFKINKFFISLESHSSFKVYLKLRFCAFWSRFHLINLLRVLLTIIIDQTNRRQN